MTSPDRLQTPERWTPVAGFPDYDVSDLGRARTWLYRGNGAGRRREVPVPLTPSLDRSTGYLKVALTRDGKAHTRYLHRLVNEAFNGPCPRGHETAHGNGDRLDCSAGNLSWKTRRENALDRIRHGTQVHGEAHPNAKLRRDQVAVILAEDLPHSALAERFHVSPAAISHVRTGRNWRRVSEAA